MRSQIATNPLGAGFEIATNPLGVGFVTVGAEKEDASPWELFCSFQLCDGGGVGGWGKPLLC